MTMTDNSHNYQGSALCLDAEWVRTEVWENDEYANLHELFDNLSDEEIVKAIQVVLDQSHAGALVDEAIYRMRMDVIERLARH